MLRHGGKTLMSRLVERCRMVASPAVNSVETSGSRCSSSRDVCWEATATSGLHKVWQGQLHSFHMTPMSSIQSTGKPPEDEAATQAGASAGPGSERDQQAAEGESLDPYAGLNMEDLVRMLEERDQTLSTSLAQAEEKTDLLKRALADMENLRQRSARQAEQTKKFAVQGFLKSMLDVGDNLERAFEAVPQEALKGIGKDGQPLTAESAIVLLNGLVNGVRLTDKIFEQGLRANSVEKYRPLGEKFDPNLHEALFEIPDASEEPGTIGAVTKTGYLLQGRVVRPAQVGVFRKP